MHTTEVSLVEFYEAGLRLAYDDGYAFVFCLIAREADTPTIFDQLARHWHSFDDLTSSEILFIFAEDGIRKHNESDSVYNGKQQTFLYSVDALLHATRSSDNNLLLDKPFSKGISFRLNDEHSRRRSVIEKTRLSTHRRFGPSRDALAFTHTSEISKLRNYLSIEEVEIPCIHIKSLDARVSKSVIVNINNNTDVYSKLKDIIFELRVDRCESIKSDNVNMGRRLRELHAKLDIFSANTPMSLFYEISEMLSTGELNNATQSQDDGVNQLLAALRTHMIAPSEASRREAFRALRAVRSQIGQTDHNTSVVAKIKKIIDLANNKGPTIIPEQGAVYRTEGEGAIESKMRERDSIGREIADLKERLSRNASELTSLYDPKLTEQRLDNLRDNQGVRPITPKQNRRAIILTALGVETRAVVRHISDMSEVIVRGTVFHVGNFGEWMVAVAECGEGNVRAAATVDRGIDYFRPEVALFVGVAGGVKDVSIGDALISTKVYGYERGKDTADGFQPRPVVNLSAYALEQRVRAIRLKNDWRTRLSSSFPHENPRIHIGAIAAGEKVVASSASGIGKFLKESYGDTLGVEMEGQGFLDGVHINAPVQGCVVRGISDLLDGKEDADKAGSQEQASDVASAVAFEMLAALPPIATERASDRG